MKTDIYSLKENFRTAHDRTATSKLESQSIWELYHNNQWPEETRAEIEARGQPLETYNVIKLFSRVFLGYFSSVVNTIQAQPKGPGNEDKAQVLTDVIQYLLDKNDMQVTGDKIKLGGLISGLFAIQITPFDTGKVDDLGNPIMDIALDYVPDEEIVLDADSVQDDYSDARFIHRSRWVTRDTVNRLWPGMVNKLAPNLDFIISGGITSVRDYTGSSTGHGQGGYGSFIHGFLTGSTNNIEFDKFLVIHTEIISDSGKREAIFWSYDTELSRTDISDRVFPWSYRVVKLLPTNYRGHYGVFREIKATQAAINQAIIKFQLLANTQKFLVEEGAVHDAQKFIRDISNVTGVAFVKRLVGVKEINLGAEMSKQLGLITTITDRIKEVLGLNEALLGGGSANESGRKFKLRKTAALSSIEYITNRVELFYKLLGEDMAAAIKTYFTHHTIIKVTDPITAYRLIELNKPILINTGEEDAQGQPIREPAVKTETQKDGTLRATPWLDHRTNVSISDTDIMIVPGSLEDEDEKTQLLAETYIQGPSGQAMLKIAPEKYFRAVSLQLDMTKTKHSRLLAKLYMEVAEMLSKNSEEEEIAAKLGEGIENAAGGDSQNPLSRQLKLPQNTNEAST